MVGGYKGQVLCTEILGFVGGRLLVRKGASNLNQHYSSSIPHFTVWQICQVHLPLVVPNAICTSIPVFFYFFGPALLGYNCDDFHYLVVDLLVLFINASCSYFVVYYLHCYLSLFLFNWPKCELCMVRFIL